MRGTRRNDGLGPSLARRLDVTTGAIVALFVVVAILVGITLFALRDDMREDQRRAVPALLANERLLTALVNQETGVRGFLLGRSDDLLDPYRTGMDAEATQDLRLHDLLASDPRGRQLLDGLEGAISNWSVWASSAVASAENGPPASAAEQQAEANASKNYFDKIRSAQRDLGAYLSARALHARDRADAARAHLAWIFIGSLLVSAAFLLLARLLFGRWVASPLADISRRVAAVPASGEATPLDHRGPRELTMLTEEIDALRARLRHQLVETQRAMEALQQRGPAVAALREQLTPTLPAIPGLTVSCELAPASGLLAGDWADIIDLGEGRWAVALIDVSGHGAHAGILALRLKQLFVAALRGGRNADETFGWTVDSIDDWGDHFATAVLVVGSSDSPVVTYANAGHPEPLLCSAAGTEHLQPTGPLLTSYTRHLGWEQTEIMLPVGARFVAYTDGITEARNATGEEFGLDRLRSCVCGGAPPRESVLRALDAVREHQPVSRDDATVLLVERDGLPLDVTGSAPGAQGQSQRQAQGGTG